MVEKKKTKAAKAKGRSVAKAPINKKRAEELTSEELIAKARAEAFTTKDPAEALEHFRSEAAAVSADGVTVFTGRPLVMLANVNEALRVLAPVLVKAVDQLKRPRLREVFELPALVLALEFSSHRVPSAKLSAGEIAKLYDEMSPLREVTLKYLEVVSSKVVNLVPEARVRAIREGSGKLDATQDAVAIPGVFTEFDDALRGKHPFTDEQLAKLGELGALLLQNIKPGGATKAPAERPPEAVLRDQFGALVAEWYDHLLVLAGLALGKARADELLPALRSARREKSAPAQPVAPIDPVAPTG